MKHLILFALVCLALLAISVYEMINDHLGMGLLSICFTGGALFLVGYIIWKNDKSQKF